MRGHSIFWNPKAANLRVGLTTLSYLTAPAGVSISEPLPNCLTPS